MLSLREVTVQNGVEAQSFTVVADATLVEENKNKKSSSILALIKILAQI